ncbi:MAG TPA: hypothetical protein DD490_02600, partial [Acidobacteria bacterium]|nr:hypothetical protein [Acidobacteriota bacterium]
MITSTDHAWAAVVKFGFSTIRVVLKELATRFAKVWPVVMSRKVTFAPVLKFEPLIVNDWGLF